VGGAAISRAPNFSFIGDPPDTKQTGGRVGNDSPPVAGPTRRWSSPRRSG
jgi:hypothetical protein